MKAGKKTLML